MAGAVLLSACPKPRDTRRASTHLDLARDLLGKGQDQQAETEVKKAIALDPENEESFLVYGLIYLVRAAHTEDLVERDNCLDDAEADGLRHEMDEAMRVAARHFARATDLADDYGEAWLNRAVVAMHFRDWDQAVELCKKALGNSGRLQSEALARANLGWALFHKKDPVRATTELLQAVKATPNLCVARYRLAHVLFARERYDEAAAELSYFAPAALNEEGKVAPCTPPVLEALYLGGQTSLRNQDPAGAVPWFQACMTAAPRSCVAKQCENALAELGASP